MAKRPNAFNTFMQDAEKRQEEQQQIEAQLTGSETRKSNRKHHSPFQLQKKADSCCRGKGSVLLRIDPDVDR